LSELTDLGVADRAIVIEEIASVSAALLGLPGVEKINVGALGNIVRQLHIHIVARHRADATWPGPVWGVGAPMRYATSQAREAALAVKERLIAGGQNVTPML
jgi:diadenosine tetraphosphate (Ap4A) HIT family hydrolase